MSPLAIATAIAVVLTVVLSFMGRRGGMRVKADLLKKLEQSRSLARGDTSKRKDCLIQLDSIMGAALKHAGVRGETVGERLKNSKQLYDRALYQDMWDAHKLRNAIVHEQHDQSPHETEVAVQAFTSAIRKALR